MGEQAHPYQDPRARVEAEIVALAHAGFSLLPLGGGPDGKAPLTRYAQKHGLSVKQVLGPMCRIGSLMYGIRLHNLAVLDLDCDDEELALSLEDRFGPAKVQVKTPRGLHMYYRRRSQPLPKLRSEGMPVDVKSGKNAYVVGPGSVRPSGEFYYYSTRHRLGETDLTVLGSVAFNTDGVRHPSVLEGARNRHLVQAAIRMVGFVDDTEELAKNLRFERDEQCQNPETVSDAEVDGIVRWAWTKRLRNSVHTGRNSAFRVNRNAIDAIRRAGGSSDALALYVTLVDQHGHTPARTFALDHNAMRKAGLTDLSRDRFRAARRALETAGLLLQVRRPVPGKSHAQFRLVTPVHGNVTRLPA